MKIIVLHGDHIEDSYKRLQLFIKEAKKRGWEITRLSDSPQGLPDLLVSKSLFGTEKFVIVDEANSINKKTWSWFKKKSQSLEGNLVIYHRGVIPKRTLTSYPRLHKVEEFKLPKLLWKFLDSFYPGNTKRCINFFHQVIKNEPAEFVFALLARHLRDLYWAKVDSASLFYPSWRISKLRKQAENFTEDKLKEIISQLARADIKAKTSKTPLVFSLDLIIATQLE